MNSIRTFVHPDRWSRLVAFAATGLLMLATDCNPPSATPDGGTVIPDNTCQDDNGCGVGESCVLGLCLRRCSVHDVCDIGQYCTINGFCEKGCRSKEDCSDGKLCAYGSCISASGNCTTKADCPSGLICKNQSCDEPPPYCTGPQDCPGTQLCNGSTRACFEPQPVGCNNATDCLDKPGCEAGNCTCNLSHECVPNAPCTLETELQSCGIGGTCHNDTCMPTPACTTQDQCEPYNLWCNYANFLCSRTAECQNSSECTDPQATFCNVAEGRCEVPSCLNGGTPCTAPDVCRDTDGRCVPPGAAECASHLECCPDAQREPPCTPGVTEYCDVPMGDVSGFCRQGCRDDGDCDLGAGQHCNSLHQCVNEGGGGGDGDSCESQDDCRANYFCGMLTGVCYELCSNPGDTCPETGKTCTDRWLVYICM